MTPRALADFAARFRPTRTRVDTRERLRVCVGAAIGILLTGLIARWWGGLHGETAWLAAPLGASAVLVFGVPASPLAQPWSVIGGNVLSALVGSLCARWIDDPAWACGLAVGLAIGVMFALRCLHPPGGATALLTALTGATPAFAVFPMLIDSALLVATAVLYNELTGRRYPHLPQRAPGTQTSRFSTADLDAALSHYTQVLDVSRDDLEDILHFAEAAAYERNFGQLSCGEVMTPRPLTAVFGTHLDEAWDLMRRRRIKALPVIDAARRVIGILTLADFMRHAGMERREGIGPRLRELIRRERRAHSGKPEVVGQIMSREVTVVRADEGLAGLIPLFSEGGHHHLPVVDEDRRLVGILTQTDLVRALNRAARPTTPGQNR